MKSTNLSAYSGGGMQLMVLLSCLIALKKCSAFFFAVYSVKISMIPKK